MRFIAVKNRLYLIASVCGLLTGNAALTQETRDVQVATARGLNIRSADGELLCAVPDKTNLTAIGRHGDGDRLKVRLSAPGCKGVKEGFVSTNFVRALDGRAQESMVEPEALSLRRQPSLNDQHWECSLPRDTRVTVLPNSRRQGADASWVKVKILNPVKGCESSEGYVAEAYLKGVDQFEDLPVVPGRRTEATWPIVPGKAAATMTAAIAPLKVWKASAVRLGVKLPTKAPPAPS